MLPTMKERFADRAVRHSELQVLVVGGGHDQCSLILEQAMHAAKPLVEFLVQDMLDNLNHQHEVELLIRFRTDHAEKTLVPGQAIDQPLAPARGRLVSRHLVSTVEERVSQVSVPGSIVQHAATPRQMMLDGDDQTLAPLPTEG